MLNCAGIRKLLCIVAVFFSILLVNTPVMSETVKKPQMTISYFYVNACGSCDEEGKFRLWYDSIIGKLDDNTDVGLEMHNTFHGSDAKVMKEYLDEYKVPEEKRQVPILFINGTYLSGKDEIDAQLKPEFIKALQSNGQVAGSSGESPDGAVSSGYGRYAVTKNKSSDSILVYFYVPSCDDCSKVSKSLKTLKSRYAFEMDGREIVSGVVLKRYNAGDAANMQLLKDYFDYCKVPEKDQKVPIIFAGNEWFSGAEAIKNGLEKALSKGQGLGTIELITENNRPDVQTNSLSGYGVLGVLATGLVNGLNPCSISIVLFYLSLLAVRKVNLLKAGIAFISGKFIGFILLGTLLYQIFLKADIVWFQSVTKVVIVILAMVFVVLNVQDMISAKKEKYGKIKLQLPESLRRFNHRIVKAAVGIESEKIFLPLSFLLGMVIAAGEFLCTGQIFLATIVLILQDSSVFDVCAILYFILYGIAFVLPLLLLTVFVYKGKEIFEVSEAVRSKMPLIKMINALIFFAFALLALFLF